MARIELWRRNERSTLCTSGGDSYCNFSPIEYELLSMKAALNSRKNLRKFWHLSKLVNDAYNRINGSWNCLSKLAVIQLLSRCGSLSRFFIITCCKYSFPQFLFFDLHFSEITPSWVNICQVWSFGTRRGRDTVFCINLVYAIGCYTGTSVYALGAS